MKEYILTQFGKVRINELPLIKDETAYGKYGKFMGFFVLVIIILLFVFLFSSNKKPKFESFAEPVVTKDVVCSVSAQIINISVDNANLLENIIIVEKNKNVIDIPIENFAKSVVGTKTMYKLDMGNKLDIGELIVVSSPLMISGNDKSVDIELVADEGLKVWEFSGELSDSLETKIAISECIVDSIVQSNIHDEFASTAELIRRKKDNTPRIIANENNFAIALTQEDEKYVSY